MDTDLLDVFAVILDVCEGLNSLCMDIPAERTLLATAITDALHEAELLAPTAE
jgi:hypothetical protein